MLRDFAHAVVYPVFGLAQGSRMPDALEISIYDVITLSLLLSFLIFSVSVIRSSFPPERIRRTLTHKRELIDNIPAALPGIVTAILLAGKRV